MYVVGLNCDPIRAARDERGCTIAVDVHDREHSVKGPRRAPFLPELLFEDHPHLVAVDGPAAIRVEPIERVPQICHQLGVTHLQRQNGSPTWRSGLGLPQTNQVDRRNRPSRKAWAVNASRAACGQRLMLCGSARASVYHIGSNARRSPPQQRQAFVHTLVV